MKCGRMSITIFFIGGYHSLFNIGWNAAIKNFEIEVSSQLKELTRMIKDLADRILDLMEITDNQN